MANTPSQPQDPPTEGASPAQNPPGKGQHGIAHGQHAQDATATPTNDRHAAETASQQGG